MFFKRTSSVSWLIAGLGNPGKKYENTRHNAGFDALDFAAKSWNINTRKSRFDSLCGEGIVAGEKVLLLKPQTFMNLSGQSLSKAAKYYSVPPERVLVLFDDVNLMPGTLRIRLSGSAGGHNGLKSIISFLGDTFPRVKIGVGDRPHPEYDMANWVLSRFTTEEKKAVTSRFGDAAAAAEMLIGQKPDEAMARYNGTAHL